MMRYAPWMVCGGGFVACTFMSAAVADDALAEENWPQRAMTIVVLFQAGGSADLLARILEEHMEPIPCAVCRGKSLGRRRQRRHRLRGEAPAGRSHAAAWYAQRQRAHQFIYGTPPYDPEHDFQPVSLLAHLPSLLVVSQKVPANTVGELIADPKANDGKLTMAHRSSALHHFFGHDVRLATAAT